METSGKKSRGETMKMDTNKSVRSGRRRYVGDIGGEENGRRRFAQCLGHAQPIDERA